MLTATLTGQHVARWGWIMHHMARWTYCCGTVAGSTGPWWTGYDPTSMVGSRPSNTDLMAQEARVRLAPLHSTAGKHSMADGEAVTVANAGMALETSPIEPEHTQSIYEILRT